MYPSVLTFLLSCLLTGSGLGRQHPIPDIFSLYGTHSLLLGQLILQMSPSFLFAGL